FQVPREPQHEVEAQVHRTEPDTEGGVPATVEVGLRVGHGADSLPVPPEELCIPTRGQEKRCMCTDCTIATPRHDASIEEPPCDTKGSGMPVTGMMPRFMPMFSNTWNSSMDSTPTQMSMPIVSADSWATRQHRQMSTANSTTRVPAPRKPNSSPATEKMKSVCWAGT